MWFWFCRTRAGYSRADQYYASYPAGTELLTDTSKVFFLIESEKFHLFWCYFSSGYDCSVQNCCQLYKAALGNCFESEEWGSFEFCVMQKHFERQGKSPYAYHAVSFNIFSLSCVKSRIRTFFPLHISILEDIDLEYYFIYNLIKVKCFQIFI